MEEPLPDEFSEREPDGDEDLVVVDCRHRGDFEDGHVPVIPLNVQRVKRTWDKYRFQPTTWPNWAPRTAPVRNR